MRWIREDGKTSISEYIRIRPNLIVQEYNDSSIVLVIKNESSESYMFACGHVVIVFYTESNGGTERRQREGEVEFWYIFPRASKFFSADDVRVKTVFRVSSLFCQTLHTVLNKWLVNQTSKCRICVICSPSTHNTRAEIIQGMWFFLLSSTDSAMYHPRLVI